MNNNLMRKLRMMVERADKTELMILSIMLDVELEVVDENESRVKLQEILSQRGDKVIKKLLYK